MVCVRVNKIVTFFYYLVLKNTKTENSSNFINTWCVISATSTIASHTDASLSLYRCPYVEKISYQPEDRDPMDGTDTSALLALRRHKGEEY